MDDVLIEKAGKGDRESMARLLYDNYEIVFRYMLKFTLNKSTAEDLVQEAMIKAIEKFNLYDPAKAKFSTWLIAVAQNIYLDNIRKIKRQQKYIEQDLQLEDLCITTDERDESWRSVLDALTKLSDDIRTPIILKHYYGHSLEYISTIMKIPVGTVKSRIHNGIKAIRKELE